MSTPLEPSPDERTRQRRAQLIILVAMLFLMVLPFVVLALKNGWFGGR